MTEGQPHSIPPEAPVPAPLRGARARGLLGAARATKTQRAVWFLRYGTLAAFILVVLIFYAALPDTYFTWSNISGTLNLATPLMLIALVLTIPLRVGDFDLSIGYQAQLAASTAVILVAHEQMTTPLAIVIVVAVALVVGTVLGAIIAYSGVSAFVVTLAAGSIILGLEIGISGNATVSLGVPQGYIDIGSARIGNFPATILVSAVTAVVLWYLQDRTVWGRNIAAVGSSKEAARLAGVRVEIVRMSAFTLVGVGCAVAGVILSSQAQAYYPNSATGLLLPAYAACFLGSTILRPGSFHVLGTAIGVIFLQAVQTGIVQLNYSPAIAFAIQGSILMVAVMTSQFGRRLTR